MQGKVAHRKIRVQHAPEIQTVRDKERGGGGDSCPISAKFGLLRRICLVGISLGNSDSCKEAELDASSKSINKETCMKSKKVSMDSAMGSKIGQILRNIHIGKVS